MSKKFFSKIFVTLLVVGLFFGALPVGQVEAASYVNWVAQLPGEPSSADTVRIWIDSNTSQYETILVEYKIGETSTKVEGVLDTSFAGANWRADIPAQAAGTVVSYQLIVHHETGGDWYWTGFNWSYTVTESSVMPVHNTTQGKYFSTIQTAVTAADEGDVIEVDAGTYNEALVINKAITLTGAGDDLSIIDGTGLTATTLVSVTDLTSGALSISGFTFLDDDVLSADFNPVSIYDCQSPATVSFTDNTFLGTNTFTGTGDPIEDRGLVVQGGSCAHTIKNNVFDNIGSNSILVEKATGPVEIDSNTFLVPSGNPSAAIWSMSYGTESVPNTVIGLHWYHDNIIRAKTDGGTISGGIGFGTAWSADGWNSRQYGSYINVLLENNTIEDFTGTGIAVEVDGEDSTFNGVIQNNTLTAYTELGNGIALSGPVNNTNILSNIVTGAQRGIYLTGTFGQAYYPTDIMIEKNQLAGNVYGLVEIDAVNDQDISPNWWGSATGPTIGQIVGNTSFTPWCADAACTTTAPDAGGNIYLSGIINVPGGILIGTPGLKYHLAANTIIQNDPLCFVIEASNTIIVAEPGAKCVLTDSSNGIDVAAGLNNITVDGLEIDGTGQTTGDGIHFAGVVSDIVLVDNKIHDLDGDGIEFVGAPTGVVDIAGNLFQNNTGLGINAGAHSVLAQYNSWGSFAGPVVDTDISSGVNATPFTHADVTLSPIYETTNRVVTSLANVSGRPTVLKDGTLYHLWYGPSDTTLYHSVSTNPAEFPVGQEVTFSTPTPLEVSSTAIFKEGETFYMVAYDGTNNQAFAIYSSTDGTAWTYLNQIFNAYGMADLGKIDAPFVFNDGSTIKLYFQKKSALGDRYDIYLATSGTVGGTYTLAQTDPVLSPTTGAWDGSFVMHPWVVKDGATYYMWYSAYISTSPQIKIGLATSTDGVNWVKNETNPMIGPSTAEPTVINDGGTWRIWYLSGATIKYQTALSPLDLRQTLAYQVTANLVNVNAADVTITYPTDLLTIAEPKSGAEIPGTFDTSVAGQISYVGAKLDKTTTTGEDVVLFNAIFLNKLLGSGDIAFSLAEFGMPGHLSSSNVYLAAEADTAEVEIKELPFLATDLDSAYYLTGEPKTFTVTITNYGTAYTEAVLDLTLPTGVTVEGLTNPIDLAIGETKMLTLTFTSTTPGEKTIGFDLKDSLGALLFSTVETATVYDKPTISSDDIDGYYLTTEEQEFSVSLTNPPTGGNYAGVLVDLKITDATLADITSLYYWETALATPDWALWTLMEDGEGNLVGTFGPPTTGFPMDAGQSYTTPFLVTFANPGEYQVDLSLRDVDTDTILATFTDTAVVYTQPTITTTLAGPYVEEVPAEVTFTITNPSGLPGPFNLVLNLPVGTTVVYNGETYTCDASGCVIPIPAGSTFPLTLNLVITFPDAYNGPISASLVDTSIEPDGRIVATYTTPDNVVVLGAFDVNGTVSMQGRSAREGVKLILTGTPGTYDAFSSTLISDNYVIEDVAEGIYTFTTYQPRYLNITAAEAKTLTLSEAETLNSLWLRGGNAMWYEMVDGVQVLTNLIDLNDASKVTDNWGVTIDTDADVNFDLKVNIQDLALVGGNMDLTSADAYSGWDPVVTP